MQLTVLPKTVFVCPVTYNIPSWRSGECCPCSESLFPGRLYIVLGLEPTASLMLDQHSDNEVPTLTSYGLFWFVSCSSTLSFAEMSPAFFRTESPPCCITATANSSPGFSHCCVEV